MTLTHRRRPGRRHGEAGEPVSVGLLLTCLLLLTAVGTMLSRATVVALPSMAEDLHASYSLMEWVLAANFLGLGAFVIVAGRIADGRLVAALRFGTLLAVVGAALCALAAQPWTLILGEACDGLGTALLIGVTFAGTTRLTRPERLGRVLGNRASVLASASLVGYFLGGLAIEHFGWRSIFAIGFVLLLVVGVVANLLLAPLGKDRGSTELPLGSASLIAIALLLLMLALNRSAEWGWLPVCLGLLVLAAAALALFSGHDRRHDEPLIPKRLLTQRQYLGGLVIRSIALLLMIGFSFFITAYLQNVESFSPGEVGLRLLPFVIVGVAVPPLTGRMVDRSGPRSAVLVGLLLVAAAQVLLLDLQPESSYVWPLLPALVLWGAGMSFVTPAAMISSLKSVPGESGGVASGTINAAGYLAAALGVTVMGFVFHLGASGAFDHSLARQQVTVDGAERRELLSLVGTKGIGSHLDTLDLATATTLDRVLRETFVTAFSRTMLVMLGLVVLCAVLALWLLERVAPAPAPNGRRRFTVRRLAIGGGALAALAVAGGIWLATSGSAHRHGATVSGPTLRIYTSLPLRGPNHPAALDVLRAEQMAVAEAGGAAGGQRIVLVPLGDSDERGFWSPGLVGANARRAARDPAAIAYVGDIDSGATALAIPILNRQGILQVSPGSTAIGLTRADPADPGSPGKYYPTGARTFARVVQNDRVQAQAMLLYAKQQGVRRLFVVRERDIYGQGLAEAVDRFATRKGIDIVGRDEVTVSGDTRAEKIVTRVVGRGTTAEVPAARPLTAAEKREIALALRLLGELVLQIRRSGADGVLFAGRDTTVASALLRGLHEADGSLKLFVPDALAGFGFTSRLGPAEQATYVTAPARKPGTYPAAGQRFLDEFHRRFGRPPQPYAIYGYEAMSAILDSIRRSSSGHANRAEVTGAFFGIRNRHSALGIYSIDRNGDTSLPYYGGYRVRAGSLVYQS
jgi:branched-chain amino acid transport system substrate-binding protein